MNSVSLCLGNKQCSGSGGGRRGHPTPGYATAGVVVGEINTPEVTSNQYTLSIF